MRSMSIRIGVVLTALCMLALTRSAARAQNPPGFTPLYQFTGATTTGYYPVGQLIKAKNGYLYGTTEYGGTSGFGTVYEASAATGAITTLYDFGGGTSDGAYPTGRLVQDSAGNTFGTCGRGGAASDGVIFEIDTTGAESILYSFRGHPFDGEAPHAGLIVGSDGKLYGTTFLRRLRRPGDHLPVRSGRQATDYPAQFRGHTRRFGSRRRAY